MLQKNQISNTLLILCVALSVNAQKAANCKYITFKELFSFKDISLKEMDATLKSKGYIIESNKVISDASINAVFLTKTALAKDKKESIIYINLICSRYNPVEQKCDRKKGTFSSPLIVISSNKQWEYNCYKESLLKDFHDFSLIEQKILYPPIASDVVEEIYQNTDYLITLRRFCKKARKKQGKIILNKITGFEIEIDQIKKE